MIFRAILAMDLKGGIGHKDGSLPWYIPEDFEWFKSTTKGGRVVMGGNTARSLKGPLPGRINYVITRNHTGFSAEWAKKAEEGSVVFFPDIVTFLRYSMEAERIDNVCFVIGGEQIYRQLMPYCADVVLTLVAGNFDCSVKIPKYAYEWPESGDNGPAVIDLYGRTYKGLVVKRLEPTRQRPFWVQMGILTYEGLCDQRES